MLVYNDNSSQSVNYVKTTNIGINKSRQIKLNIRLNYNLVKTLRK